MKKTWTSSEICQKKMVITFLTTHAKMPVWKLQTWSRQRNVRQGRVLPSAHKNTLRVPSYCVRGRLIIVCVAPRPTAWRDGAIISKWMLNRTTRAQRRLAGLTPSAISRLVCILDVPSYSSPFHVPSCVFHVFFFHSVMASTHLPPPFPSPHMQTTPPSPIST